MGGHAEALCLDDFVKSPRTAALIMHEGAAPAPQPRMLWANGSVSCPVYCFHQVSPMTATCISVESPTKVFSSRSLIYNELIS